MDNSKFSCIINTTDALVPLGINIILDNKIIFSDSHVLAPINVNFPIPLEERNYTMKFELFGKLPEHTFVDKNNAILKDACLEISNICFDEINIDTIISKISTYKHDFNGTAAASVSDKFYGQMGCNGQVSFEYESPVYLWLLEKM